MRRAAIRLVLCGALVCLTAAAAPAQTTTTSETKKFQVISVDGNTLVVKLPEGTREMAVADDFRFNVDGKMLSVQELKPGMTGTATITTKTTVTPVTVTEVKNGTVMQNLGTSILVRTDDGMKMFSQADIDKRGIKIRRDGKLAEISDFRANDKLTATIVTTKPPRVMTEREVNATLAKSGGGAGGGVGAGAGAGAVPVLARLRPHPARGIDATDGSRVRPPRGPRVVRRGSCPRRPAPCRFLRSQASPRSSRRWPSPSGVVARRTSGSPLAAGPRSRWIAEARAIFQIEAPLPSTEERGASLSSS